MLSYDSGIEVKADHDDDAGDEDIDQELTTSLPDKVDRDRTKCGVSTNPLGNESDVENLPQLSSFMPDPTMNLR